MIRKKTYDKKHQAISEYLTGNETYLALERKYNIKARTIQTWVRKYRQKNEIPLVASKTETTRDLKRQLEEAQLKSELLEEILRLSEQQTGIDFRKKFGAKRS